MSQKPMTKKLTNKEIAWYVVASVLAVAAIVFIVFGIIGDHFPGKYEDNWVLASEKVWLTSWTPLGYRWWGVVLLALSALIAAITLNVFAKETDRDTERAQRRAQRLAMASSEPESKPETPAE